MAKKTTPARAKTAPKAAVKAAAPEAPAPAPKPKAKARAPKKTDASRTVVAVETTETVIVSTVVGPTEEDIRIRAYHRYIERGGHHGQDLEDWVEAERELRERS